METIVALVVVGVGAYWWQRRAVRARKAAEDNFDDDAGVVLHVARHEALRRHDPRLTVPHLLYGLLQLEAITDAIRAVGGDGDRLEDRALAALDREQPAAVADDAEEVLGRALTCARSCGRKASPTDLWAYLLRSKVTPLAGPEVDGLAVLHQLVHGRPLPALTARPGAEVTVVIGNDDFTTSDFVTELLVRVFELPPESAETKMRQVHTEGRGVVGRMRAAEAHAKIREARELARSHWFPLWIADEPA